MNQIAKDSDNLAVMAAESVGAQMTATMEKFKDEEEVWGGGGEGCMCTTYRCICVDWVCRAYMCLGCLWGVFRMLVGCDMYVCVHVCVCV